MKPTGMFSDFLHVRVGLDLHWPYMVMSLKGIADKILFRSNFESRTGLFLFV